MFHAHTGRYEIEDSMLIIRPELAKSPNTMDGRVARYGWSLDGDRLTVIRRAPEEREVRVTHLERVERW